MRSLLFLPLFAACANAATPATYMAELGNICMSQDCYLGTDGTVTTATWGTLPGNIASDPPPHRGCVPMERPWWDMNVQAHVTLHGLDHTSPLMRTAQRFECELRDTTMDVRFGPFCTVRYVPAIAPRGIPHLKLTQLASGQSVSWAYIESELREIP